MRPSQIHAKSLSTYPPEAHALLIKNLPLIRQLPLVLAAYLLNEVKDYDWRFPAEQRLLDSQLKWLASLSPVELHRQMSGFAQVSLSEQLMRNNWVRDPQQFFEMFSAYLWKSGQINSFDRVASQYSDAWRKAMPEISPIIPRIVIIVLGKNIHGPDSSLFAKLRPHGTYFPKVDSTDGWQTVREAILKRSTAHPVPYGHWYIDGGTPDHRLDSQITSVSWTKTSTLRSAVIDHIHKSIQSGDGGPTSLRTSLAELTPEDLKLHLDANDQVLEHFKVNVFTRGQGTQIFSTTFAEWTARQALSRAQPLTVLLRYAPRQRQLPMNKLLSDAFLPNQTDPEGSLMDADMGSYLIRIDQQRLTGATSSGFIVWCEDLNQAVAIGPVLPRGTSVSSKVNIKQILEQIL